MRTHTRTNPSSLPNHLQEVYWTDTLTTAHRIKLTVSKDGMAVTADITAGAACGVNELRAALQAANVVFIADAKLIQELAQRLADPQFTAHAIVVAQGAPARPSRDGYFEPAFHVGIQPGHVDESGTMDFFNRELLKPLAAEEYVGQLHAPVQGVPGKRVDGAELKVAAARPAKLRVGPGIRSAPDGRMYAAHPGVLVYTPDTSIDVARVHVHARDVDLRSGNLNMEGALTVKGSVQHQFSARATGDVEIAGGVECGSVSAGGNVRIRGGVRGGESGVVCAEGDVTLHHAEGAYIRAGGQLKLESAIHSDIAANRIRAERMIRGGSAAAEVSLVVQEAGAPNTGSGTLLAAGLPLERPVCDIRIALAAQKEQRNLQRAGGVRDADERAKGGKVGRANAAIAQKALAVKAELAAHREQLLPGASVQVLGRAHAGVTIQLGVHSVVLDEPQNGTRFTWDAQKREIRRERQSR